MVARCYLASSLPPASHLAALAFCSPSLFCLFPLSFRCGALLPPTSPLVALPSRPAPSSGSFSPTSTSQPHPFCLGIGFFHLSLDFQCSSSRRPVHFCPSCSVHTPVLSLPILQLLVRAPVIRFLYISPSLPCHGWRSVDFGSTEATPSLILSFLVRRLQRRRFIFRLLQAGLWLVA